MFSTPVHHEPRTEEKRPEENRRPAPFRRKAKANPVSDDIKRRSLSALKELLRKQKGETQGAAPFSQFFAADTHSSASDAITLDPSAQVMQLYEKLLDKMIHTDKNGIKQTSLILDGDAFSSSLFSGAKITITEYSTAPKIFNIQFAASPEALRYFEGHAASLLSALKNGKFGFTVNRLDTELVERKGPPERIQPVREEKE